MMATPRAIERSSSRDHCDELENVERQGVGIRDHMCSDAQTANEGMHRTCPEKRHDPAAFGRAAGDQRSLLGRSIELSPGWRLLQGSTFALIIVGKVKDRYYIKLGVRRRNESTAVVPWRAVHGCAAPPAAGDGENGWRPSIAGS